MKFLSFDTAGMEDEQVMILKETYDALTCRYKIQFSKDHKSVNQLLPNQNVQIAGILLIQKAGKKCILIFTMVFPQMSTMNWTDPKENYKSFQVYALSNLNHDFGNAFIRRKKIVDIILEKFTSVALNFKNDIAFNRKLYVVADKKEESYSSISEKFRSLMMMISDVNFLINVRGRNLVVESADKLNTENTLLMPDFAYSINGL